MTQEEENKLWRERIDYWADFKEEFPKELYGIEFDIIKDENTKTKFLIDGEWQAQEELENQEELIDWTACAVIQKHFVETSFWRQRKQSLKEHKKNIASTKEAISNAIGLSYGQSCITCKNHQKYADQCNLFNVSTDKGVIPLQVSKFSICDFWELNEDSKKSLERDWLKSSRNEGMLPTDDVGFVSISNLSIGRKAKWRIKDDERGKN